MSEVPTTYWYKELLSNPVWLPNGRQAPWEPVGEDTGVLCTNDANTIFHLSGLAARRVGGIVRIDEGRYLDAKKNSSPTSPRLLEREAVGAPSMASPARLAPPAPPPVARVEAAAAAGAGGAETTPAPPRAVRVGKARAVAAKSVLP